MNQDHKLALVTGSTRGIGAYTALMLARQGHSVIVTGRSQLDCDRSAQAIRSEVAGCKARGKALDLSSLASVRGFAQSLLSEGEPISLLINNAGRLSLDDSLELTADGIEVTLATNVIGPFLLTNLLLGLLERAAPARIVNVSSRVHMPKSPMGGGEVNWDWDDLQGEKSYNPVVLYKNSKLAMMWFTYELNRRFANRGVVANAVCPGFVPETLAEHKKGFSRFLHRRVLPHLPGAHGVREAANNTIFAATDPAFATRGGVFLGELKEIPSSIESYDVAQAQRFWRLACDLTGLPSN